MTDYFMTQNKKVAIIGAGNVGSSIAYALAIRNLAREIVLIDKAEERAKGEALDIQHGIPFLGMPEVRAGTYKDCANCDLIIVTAGRNRKVGETRLDLAKENVEIIVNVIYKIKQFYTRGVILIVSNPVDILTFKCSKILGLPDGRVFGTGTILDTSRLVSLVADYTGLNSEMIKACVVGEHGDGQVPIWSMLSVAGVSIGDYCSSVGLEWNSQIKISMESKVRGLGAEIIAGKGKTHYGIATCVCYIADAILNQRLIIAPVTSVLHGEYDVSDVALSVPSIIGANGIERRLEEPWTDFEKNKFLESAEKLKQFINSIEKENGNE